MRQPLASVLITILFAALCASNTRAQTGSIDPTMEQLSGLRVMEAPELQLVEEKVVDLRRWMPPVGNQSMNDCTAWAVGYGAKSYLEARDQGWKPDTASRVFSPTFLYNQLNGGTDDGTNFYKMVQFMIANGAATLSSTPYAAGDFKRQPTEKAKTEARAFPVLDVILMKNRKSIRRALQRRQVVVFGAHVNPVFLAGRFDLYSAELFVQDGKMRQPNQRHGKHAMVIVGYDDSRNAFLIQNSWGTKWNQRGYAWVAYELFDNIKIAENDSVFCNWACTIEDVEEPIEIGADGVARPKPLDRTILKAYGYSDISRYDQAIGKYVYVFSGELRGPRALLDDVTEVAWTWVAENGEESTFTCANSQVRFGMVAGTVQNPLKLKGLVKFKDGSTRKVERDIVGPNPKADFRDAKIIFEDDYYGPGNGVPEFWWEATLDYPLEQRNDIVKVVWNVGPNMNSRDPVQTMTGFNGKPGDEKAMGMCRKPSRITAEIHYIDGGIKTVSLDPVLTDDVSEEFKIEVDKRKIGREASGRDSYSWVLTIDRPHRKQFDIEHVVWTLDPLFSPSSIWANQTFQRYPAFGTANRDFRAIATLHMADGTTKTLEQWIVLGPTTGYADEDRVDIESWNRYRGREDGKPIFTGHLRLIGDRRQLEKIAHVYFQEETDDDHKEYEVATDKANPTWGWTVSGGEEAILNARIVFQDGHERKFRHVHKRTLLADDNMGFSVSMDDKPKTYVDFSHQDAFGYSIEPVGPDEDLIRVIGVDWYHNVIGPRERSEHRFNRTGFGDGMFLTSALTAPFELEARLHYHTGFYETIGLKMSRFTSGVVTPDLSLRVREKFWGYEDGKPTWLIRMEIARDESVWPAAVTKAVYRLQSIDRPSPFKPLESTSSTGYFEARIDRPCAITAEVTFADGRTATLTSFAEASAPRMKDPIHLLKLHDNYAVSWPTKWLLVVDAWESDRDQIASVTFDAEYDDFDRTSDYKDGVPGMIAYERSGPGPETMKVAVTRKDGTTTKWEVVVGDALAPLNWSYSIRYWGQQLWQIDSWAIGDWWYIKDLGKSLYLEHNFTPNFEDVGAWPLSRKRAYAKAGTYTIKGGTYYGDGKLAGTTFTVGRKGETPSEVLQLSVAPSPFKHERATVPEWVLAIVGPEGLMTRIVEVTYDYEDDKPRSAHVTHRWGEFYSAFEHRAFGTEAPAVKATVKLDDGTETVLQFGTKK